MIMKAKEEGRSLPVIQIMVILRDILMAVLHLHSHNPPIAHRDIQCKNILYGTDGTYKLTHFGNASMIHGTPKGTVARTIATEDIRQNSRVEYRAPEQVDLCNTYVLNEKVDIWALGVLLFTLFYFVTPFEGASDEATSNSILRGFNTGKALRASKGRLVSRGVVEIMGYCMTLNPLKRPTCGMVLKRCESLHAGQILPYWPGTRGNIQPLTQSPKSPMVRSPRWSPIRSSSHSVSPVRSSKGPYTKKETSNSCASASPTNTQCPSSFTCNVGETKAWEGVLSKWYKLVGGEHRKRLWVLKVTSRCPCAPKPKYIHLIVGALWKNALSLDGFFQLLRYRPLAESPIIAVKALTTILKALRQGPPHCLTECSTYVGVIDEIGQMWTTTLGIGQRPYGYEDEKLDEPLVLLIGKLASMLVQKVRFHHNHPEYAEIFTTIPARDAKEHIPGVEEDSLDRVLGALGRLLALQEHTLATIDSAMLVVNGDLSTGVVSEGSLPTVSMLHPLAEESYVTWVATARLMSAMAKLSNTMSASCMDRYSALELQYKDQVYDVKRLLQRLGDLSEARELQPPDMLTSGVYNVEEGIGELPKEGITMSFESSSWVHSAQSKAEVMVALQRGEELVEQQATNKSATKDGPVKQEDDDVSDNDEEYRELQHDCTSSWPKRVPVQNRVEFDRDPKSVSHIPPRMNEEGATTLQRAGSGVNLNRHQLSPVKGGDSAAFMPPLPTRNNAGDSSCMTTSNPQLRVNSASLIEEKSAVLERKGLHPFPPFPPQRMESATSKPTDARNVCQTLKGVSIASHNSHEYRLDVIADDGALQDIRGNGGMDQSCIRDSKGVIELDAKSSSHQKQQQYGGKVVVPTCVRFEQQDQLLNTEREKKRVAVAKYNYEAQGAEQLSFSVNDIIILHCDKVNGKGWGLGEINGKMGWFPGEYVSFLQDTVSVNDVCQLTLQNGEEVSIESESSLDPNLLPEHKFAIQMARAEPWKDSLSAGGQRAYAELVEFFRSTQKVINFDALNLEAVIGSGAFAIVFRAVYLKRSVAVKKLIGGGGGPMERNLRDFQTEAALLSQLRHPNIIAPVGATIKPVSFIMDYCSRGNLMSLLMDSSISLHWEKKKKMLEDVASGMQYLHHQDPVIIHRDLKSLNILIDENWVAKVSDFGLSRFKAPTVSEKMTGQAGTYHWMAPEVINSQHYTEKADIYSFGIIMWEVSFRSIPYDGMQPVQIVAAVLGRRERPRIPPGTPKRLAVLIQECWQHNPSLRPSFDEIFDRLVKFRFMPVVPSNEIPSLSSSVRILQQ